MKKYIPAICIAVLLLVSAVLFPVLADSPDVSTATSDVSELPNIVVLDQFCNPVKDLLVNVRYDHNGQSTEMLISTTENGLVLVNGGTGTYTFTVNAVPDGYEMSDQKILQKCKNGSVYDAKVITVNRKDGKNPYATQSSNNNASGSVNNYYSIIEESDKVVTPVYSFDEDAFLNSDKFKDKVYKIMAEGGFIAPGYGSGPTPTPTPIPTPTPVPTPYDPIVGYK